MSVVPGGSGWIAARVRLRVTHRDAPDFYLTAADREDQSDETLTTASRIFLALRPTDGDFGPVEVTP
ncbi:hypothetical protein [Actinoallomurus iriomotensis]|uniref:hypothetical protein n=1 Tax=Actinoallomurus iriomotensis TaxID=478107 RepID=UPI0025570790|nr:hypothetical protein [Actinoallomurus iriomotensis]